MKKPSTENWELYLVTDAIQDSSRDIYKILSEAIAAGISVLQLRDKKCSDEELTAFARKIRPAARAKNIPLIINDRIEVAKRSGADGVHLGQEDASFAEARAALGGRALIGRSTHSPQQALQAEKEGFDYIGVGPVFGTPTKPDYTPVGLELVTFASKNIRIPFVAIGGIDESNIKSVRDSGARTAAVVRAVMNRPDTAPAISRLLKEMRG